MDGSGAGHGGYGGATSLGGVLGGSPYCTTSNPSTIGSGGGGAFGSTGHGGAGGGFIKLTATGNLTIAGFLLADGGNGVSGGSNRDGGGGAGGAMKLAGANVNLTSGSLIATGGDTSNPNNEGGGGGGGGIHVSYSGTYSSAGVTTSTAGGSGANPGTNGSFVLASANTAPSLTAIAPYQSGASAVTVTTTVSDINLNETSLTTEYSLDNVTWASSTLGNVTQGGEGDGVVTSTGSITGIDTDVDGSVDLTVIWDIGGSGLSGLEDPTVYFRLLPFDGLVYGTMVNSTAFSIDTAAPSLPGNLSVNTTSTTSVILNLSTTSTDSNFSEYKIFYATSTPVTESALVITSTTDPNLASSTFAGATTTTISGLSANTNYYTNIFAYDSWGRGSSSTAETNFYTLVGNPTGLATTSVGMTSAAFTVDAFNNDTSGSSGYYYNLIDEVGVVTTTGWTTTRTWSVTGLTVNSGYGVQVNYRNGNGVPVATSSLSFYTLTSVPANVSATANSQSQITVSWTGNGTQYYVENITAGTNSGWITASSYAFTNLTAGTPYSFRVKAQNKEVEVAGVGTQTDWSSTVSATTQSASGGGAPLPPPNNPPPAEPPPENPPDNNPPPENPPEEPAPDQPEPENPDVPEPPEKPAKPPAKPPAEPTNPEGEPEVPGMPEPDGVPGPTGPTGGGEPGGPGGGGGTPGGGSPGGGSYFPDFVPISVSAPMNNFIDEVKTVIEAIPQAVEFQKEVIKQAAAPVVKAVKYIADNPKVEKANEIAVAPAIVAAGAANVAVGFNATQVLLFFRHIFAQPLLLLRLRKRKSWGVIYNALNKMPVDLAVVRLIEESTGRIVQSQVTDAQGRYLITVEPGEYHLEVDKAGFSGFSKLLQDKEEDAKFIHLYHGGKFQITEAGTESVLNYNIPLDPVDEVKGNNLVIKEYTKRVTQNAICAIGLLASVLSFVISPKPIIFAFVLLHFLFYWLFYRFSHRKVTAGSFGSVTEMIMDEPIGKVVVRVFDSLYNKLVDTAVTDHKGRYAVLVGPSQYYTTYEKDGFEKKQSEILDFSSEKTSGMGGLINRDEKLNRVDKQGQIS